MKKLIKCFKFQKVMFVISILAIVINTIFALSFMTQYNSLSGLELEFNNGITNFYNSMQSFNKEMFFMSLFGLICIIVMFMLEANKKVPDKFALLILGLCFLVIISCSIFEIIKLNDLMSQYKNVDFQYAYLEDDALSDYKLKFETFYLGYGVFGISIVSSLLFIVSLVSSHIAYLKKGELKNEEK